MKITVKRYDPSKDNAPYETTYEVPYDDEYMTPFYKPSCTFTRTMSRWPSTSPAAGAMCGRCAMMLDGEPVLACVEPLA